MHTPTQTPGRYPTAVVVRMHTAERAAMNAAAIAAGMSLQNYCRARFGLPLPEPSNRIEKPLAKGTSHNESKEIDGQRADR